jgi:prepilin-type N-terminal cleavage/methylation domain-containing protein
MRSRHEAGVTLIEMVIVMALVGLIAAISFPALNAGLESIRLVSASDSVASFLNAGLNRAERRQEGMEIMVSTAANELSMRSTDPSFARTLAMPDGITILQIHPPLPNGVEATARTFYVFPGGTIPRIGIEVANRRGARRIIRVDPTTGVPQIEQPQEAAN